MNTFEVGKIVHRVRIGEEKWVFEIIHVSHLTDEEYARNEAFNDTLGDWDPENELPTNSLAVILASSSKGDTETLNWSSGMDGVYPHINRKGWTKGLFVKLNEILRKWHFAIA